MLVKLLQVVSKDPFQIFSGGSIDCKETKRMRISYYNNQEKTMRVFLREREGQKQKEARQEIISMSRLRGILACSS